MPNDVITLKAVAAELNAFLNGGRIEKIYQPENDEITFAVKANGKTNNMVISANPSQPRIHISSQKKENSFTAPAFCMLLRKYLIGGTINNISIYNYDRIIKIDIDARNELKDRQKYYLMAELMGRYSNIILLNENNIIIDAIKRIHLDQSTERYILPNLNYTLQHQNKLTLEDKAELHRFFELNINKLTVEALIQNISGISKDTAKEIICRNGDAEKSLIQFYNIYSDKEYYPCIRKQNGQIKDYYITKYISAEGEYIHLPSLNACLDYYYNIYDGTERKKANTKQLTLSLKRLDKKIQKRISDNYQKIEEAENSIIYKQKGDLILSNLYLIKPRQTILKCIDYYNGGEVEIDINPLLSPSDNAQAYYKRYTKAKRAKDIALEQLPALKQQADYLKTIAVSIQNCELKQEFDEILAEIEICGGKRIQSVKNNKKKSKKSQPLHIKINGFDVYIGKNSSQNVAATFEIGNGGDLWLHAKDYHGSHALIKGSPDDNTIYQTAQIAAFYSDGRNNQKTDVDYTLRKYVKKQPGSYEGMVTYTNYQTITVIPSDENAILKSNT